MGLRAKAKADSQKILNSDAGFAWPITVTGPDGTIGNLKGFSNDITDLIDPDTGVAVTSRLVTATLHIADLTAAGLGIPEAIADKTKKPWIIEFDDIDGNPFKFKVMESKPDRTIGNVSCILEFYE